MKKKQIIFIMLLATTWLQVAKGAKSKADIDRLLHSLSPQEIQYALVAAQKSKTYKFTINLADGRKFENIEAKGGATLQTLSKDNKRRRPPGNTTEVRIQDVGMWQLFVFRTKPRVVFSTKPRVVFRTKPRAIFRTKPRALREPIQRGAAPESGRFRGTSIRKQG